ncbi:hypothetical protein LMH73_004570 [Vibrio splendidus]|nr:hypothetical protein [Vibrio splendidus]MCC4882472.1 hypothetical protein [Vibrio splendidus]
MNALKFLFVSDFLLFLSLVVSVSAYSISSIVPVSDATASLLDITILTFGVIGSAGLFFNKEKKPVIDCQSKLDA